jgi:hypothetical protein
MIVQVDGVDPRSLEGPLGGLLDVLAGIHLGEFLQRDMVAVKVTGEQRAAIVAAPLYFRSHPKPEQMLQPTLGPDAGAKGGLHG